jgi:homoserine dehydrogenase
MRIILTGLGNVGRSVLAILHSQADLLRGAYGFEVQVVGVADSSGAAFHPDGLDIERIRAAKSTGTRLAQLTGVGRPGMSGLELLDRVQADVVLEATPVNLRHGQPGLDLVRAALANGLDCVLANKAPLALAYPELAALSDLSHSDRPALRFSACVGGALPTINLGLRDLAGSRILKVEAILNGTCQGILRAMESGWEFEPALVEMQRRGVAETDPTLDVDGWDQAVKLVILANAVLRRPTVVADVSVTGIRQVTVEDLRAAEQRGERLVLLATAERAGSAAEWRLTVGPTSLPLHHPLARMGGDEMGIVYQTDISGTLHATSREGDAVPTAAAMLRDLISLRRD